MDTLYVRVSSDEQKTERQRLIEKDYDFTVEDKCSGAIAFFEREGGRQIKALADRGDLNLLAVWQIDRLGRDVRDILNSIHFFTEKKICIHFVSQGLQTLDEDGNENPIAKMIIAILGVVSEMERNQIKERTRQGIAIAKAKGVYKGRKAETKEDVLKFLSKEKNKRVQEYLKMGLKSVEAAKLSGVHPNTVTKIRKLAQIA